jgi:uncharacterized protein
MNTDSIKTLAELRSLYEPARERSVKKQLSELDDHCKHFILLSPFVVLSSVGASGVLDASPRGGEAGFVKVTGSKTLLIPDASGNNRLDTLENIVSTGKIGLLFLVPGIDETLRVNGNASLTISKDRLDLFQADKKPPKLVIEVTVLEAYLHCAKALMRAQLWDASLHVERSVMPSMGEMLKSQIGGNEPAETQQEMLIRYAASL